MKNNNMLIIADINFKENAGDTTLLLRRAKSFYEVAGVSTVVCVVRAEYMPNFSEESSMDGITFQFIGRDVCKLYGALEKYNPLMVLLTFENTYHFVNDISKFNHLRKQNIKIYIDGHGALHEAIDYSKGYKRIKKILRFCREFARTMHAVRKADGFFCVTEELKNYYLKFIPFTRRKGFDFIKINCGYKTFQNEENLLQWRNIIRNGWKLAEDTRVIVFSGYQRPWHCFEEMLEWFSNMDKKNHNLFFAFFTNADNELKDKIKEKLPKGNYFIQLLDSNELIRYLSACDVGVLMRDNKWTNYVAFPNKFSDYLGAGLFIALSPSLREPLHLLKRNDMPYIEISEKNETSTINHPEIKRRSENIKLYYNKCRKIIEKELSYDAQVFNGAKKIGFFDEEQ